MFRPSTVEGLDDLAGQLQSRLASLDVGNLLHGPDGRIEAVSPGAQRLLGVPAEALLGRRSALEAVAAFDSNGRPLPLSECPSIRCQENGEDVPEVVVRADRPDGRIVWLALSSHPLSGRQGERAGSVTSLLDVTERHFADVTRRRLYQDAREALRTRDQFLAIAAHELRSPVTALLIQLQSLIRRGGSLDADDLLKGLNSGVRQTQRLKFLVDVLMDVAQVSGGQLQLAVKDVDLAQLVQEVVERSRDDLERVGCDVRLHAQGSIKGRWDPLRLEQVVANLLSNAARYAAGTPVDVEVERREDGAAIRVRDLGVGIAAGDQDRIFGRYERATSERDLGGLGLGLWIVREIVEAHGGSVSVRSSEGNGAQFEVHLPLNARGAAVSGESTPRPG